jgi:hypothetical protein
MPALLASKVVVVTYGPALANGCSLLDGPARVRSCCATKTPFTCFTTALDPKMS